MQNNYNSRSWILSWGVPIKKTRAKQPIQLDLIEFINKEEKNVTKKI